MTIGSAAFAEGLLWAMAFWIKPFIAVPALACWLLSARMAWSGSRRIVLVDGAAILAGGVTAGAAGIVWLIATGAWPAFVEVMFVWNREYVVHDVTQGQYALCVAGLAYRFFPWILVHLVAVPVAFGAIRRGDVTQTLLAGMYLGWLVQSVCLQHLFDYVHTPPVLLGLTVAASWCVSLDRLPTRRMVAVLFLLAVFVRFPALCLDRVTVWGDCLRQGSTATLRDRLTLLPKTNWADLARVKDFLREQEIQHGELSCMDMPTISLYTELGVRPATRFHFLHNFVAALPRQRGVIYAELAASDQRFMLCDSESPSRERLSEDMTERVVFRAGRYVVMRLSGPETPEWIEAQFRNIHR